MTRPGPCGETAKKAQAEIESWPAWKHNELPRESPDASASEAIAKSSEDRADARRLASVPGLQSQVVWKWCGRSARPRFRSANYGAGDEIRTRDVNLGPMILGRSHG